MKQNLTTLAVIKLISSSAFYNPTIKVNSWYCTKLNAINMIASDYDCSQQLTVEINKTSKTEIIIETKG